MDKKRERVKSYGYLSKMWKTGPAWKLIFLTNFNTITCPTCSARLRANKRINSLIGGIGGGVDGSIGGLRMTTFCCFNSLCCFNYMGCLP